MLLARRELEAALVLPRGRSVADEGEEGLLKLALLAEITRLSLINQGTLRMRDRHP